APARRSRVADSRPRPPESNQMRSSPQRGTVMTACVLRLQRAAFSYLLGLGVLAAAALLASGAVVAPAWGQSANQPAATGPTGGQVPGNALGNQADSDLWRAIRQGETGYVSIPDPRAGQL